MSPVPTRRQYIDSHAHIDGAEFDEDRDDVLGRARAAGVTDIVLVAAPRTIEELERPILCARTDPRLHATVGVHPHDARLLDDAWWRAIEELARDPKCVAIGETGLDFYYDHSPRDVQLAAFDRHIGIARAARLPVVCHVRDAHAEAHALLRDTGVGRGDNVGGVIHCFTGTAEDAAAYAALGLYVSFSGIITFKTAENIREAVRRVPRERILIETDAPFLAPIPHRGKRNEPAFIVHTAEVVAREAGIDVDELAELTAANARALFSLSSRN